MENDFLFINMSYFLFFTLNPSIIEPIRTPGLDLRQRSGRSGRRVRLRMGRGLQGAMLLPHEDQPAPQRGALQVTAWH